MIDNADSIDEVGTIDNDGSVIVSAFLAVAGGSGSAGIAGAVAIDEISNDRTASISNSTITANNVAAKADADALLVGVAAGGGGSSTFGGTGSVSWHEVENDVTATVDKFAVTADALDVLADNDALLIDVAGQVSAGKVGVGATVAYQSIDNMTVPISWQKAVSVSSWKTTKSSPTMSARYRAVAQRQSANRSAPIW